MEALILRHWLAVHCLPLNTAETTTTHPVRLSLSECVSGYCKEWKAKVYSLKDGDSGANGVILVQTKVLRTSRDDNLVQTPTDSRLLARCITSSPRADFLPSWSSQVDGTPSYPLQWVRRFQPASHSAPELTLRKVSFTTTIQMSIYCVKRFPSSRHWSRDETGSLTLKKEVWRVE